MLPIENSYAGEVAQVNDLMFQGNLFLNGVYTLNVQQNLLGVPGTSLSDIKQVISHPQALEQCADFLREHNLETVEAVNTARAAKQVAEQNDKSVAAIASKETAELYGLTILAEGINEKQDNSTRFAILSRDGEKRFSQNEKTELLWQQRRKPKSLTGEKSFGRLLENTSWPRISYSRTLKKKLVNYV